MPTIVTLGEAMLRFTPADGEHPEAARHWIAEVGGAESNVAIALARLGLAVGWVSRLPTTWLGRRVARVLRGHGVDVSRVLWTTEGRLGLYFVHPGVPPRPAQVLYDRAGSALATIDPDEVDWAYVRTARVVHLTGITPALGAGPRRLVERAIAEVHAAGGLVSFDVNYRARLWAPEAARQVIEPLLEAVDLLLLGRTDLRALFPDLATDAVATDDEAALRALAARFRPRVAVLRCGAQGALALAGDALERCPALPAAEVDRLGRGDAFTAGFLYGYLEGSVAQALRYGVAIAALKMTYPGDACWATRADLQQALAAEATDIVR